MTIQYNILNLPSIIQFKNGSQIKNLYDAGGQKLRSDYYTYKLALTTPLTDGQVLEPIYSTTNYDFSGTAYLGNVEYSLTKTASGTGYTDTYTFNRLNNAEGYVAADGKYYYYRRDHLGDNREVWCATTNTTVQKTQYYPSGLTWAESSGTSVQPYKYNGKEFREMYGYDTYDIVWRQYYPAIMRFQTPDPEVENDYDLSPYSMCGDNMILHTDPDGRVFGIDNLVGAVVGAAVDYGSQVIANYASGSEHPFTQNINLVSIGTAAVVGGITSGASVVTKTVVSTTAAVVNNTVKVKTSSEGISTEVQTNPVNIIKNTAIDMTANKIIGSATSKFVGTPIAKSATTNAGRLNSTAKVVVKATRRHVTRAVTASVKSGVQKTAKVAEKVVKEVANTATNNTKQKIKDKTDINN